ncbi:hypothetical protein [Intestinibacillus massiliensis]|uniref:hypothetical protein n=1 Tax=Intestinibacillus massiliensis TaxID=1871029 RepID=UPI000B34EB86|nr:hypothetical protein [Intestinibacillus massiliensis]
MKKLVSLLLSVIMIASLAACGEEKETTTNTIVPTALTAREQMLVGSQDIFMYDFETDSTYKTITVTVEAYKNGEKISNAANLQCTIPSNAEKGGNNQGSLAVMLSADHRFSAAVCDKDGSVISAFGSDVVEPVAELTKTSSIEIADRQAIPASGDMTLAYLAYGDAEKTQGTFVKNVFLDPASNAEQSAAFDRIYLIKCSFH